MANKSTTHANVNKATRQRQSKQVTYCAKHRVWIFVAKPWIFALHRNLRIAQNKPRIILSVQHTRVYMALYTVRRSSLGLVLWPRLQGGGFAGRWGCGSSWHYTQPLRLSCTMMFFMALQDSVISRKIHWEWRNTGNTQLHILHGPAGQCDFQENPLGMEEYWQLCNTPHHRLH